MSHTEINISINPLCEEIISDFLISEINCHGVILKETYYNDEKIVKETQGVIKTYFFNSSDSYFNVEEFQKKLSEKKEQLLSLGLSENELGEWQIIKTDEIEDEDWADNWKKYWDVQKIGERTIICPSWLEYEPEKNEIKIELDPGSAFGTGTHPTTRLCIKALEKYVKNSPTVADIGTGSGILAIASKMYGASKVIGVDNDESVIQVAKDNAEKNNIDTIVFYEGSAADVEGTFDIVVANILANVIVNIMEDLAKLAHPKSKLILSGILREQNEKVIASLCEHNLDVVEILEEENWSCIIAGAAQK